MQDDVYCLLDYTAIRVVTKYFGKKLVTSGETLDVYHVPFDDDTERMKFLGVLRQLHAPYIYVVECDSESEVKHQVINGYLPQSLNKSPRQLESTELSEEVIYARLKPNEIMHYMHELKDTALALHKRCAAMVDSAPVRVITLMGLFESNSQIDLQDVLSMFLLREDSPIWTQGMLSIVTVNPFWLLHLQRKAVKERIPLVIVNNMPNTDKYHSHHLIASSGFEGAPITANHDVVIRTSIYVPFHERARKYKARTFVKKLE